MQFDLIAENVAFRRGYYADEVSGKDLSELNMHQMIPNLPVVYAEKQNLINSKDILEAKLSKDDHVDDWYFLDIKLSDNAINALNDLCFLTKSPYVVLYIKGIPFYMVRLNGPFKSDTVRWDIIGDSVEAELLFSNFKNCES